MKHACTQFRQSLAGVLERRSALVELGWHEHLFTCEDCRALLAGEEALEHLLASLPEPVLPPDLARRVLARLAAHRAAHLQESADPLDALLDAAPVDVAPPDLAARVLDGLRSERVGAERSVSLDDLLALVPEPDAPRDLAQRVLAGLEAERRPAPQERRAPGVPVARGRLLAFRRALVPTLIAAAGVLLFALWLAGRDRNSGGLATPDPSTEIARAHAQGPAPSDTGPVAPMEPDDLTDPDPELLASLDLLQNWEALASEDLDLLLDGLDETEAILLESEFQSSQTNTQPDQG